MFRKKNPKGISIQNTILVVFVILTVMTVSLISLLVFSNWRSSSRNTTNKIAYDTNTEIFRQIEAFMHSPIHINEVNQKLIMNRLLDMHQEEERERFFVGVLLTHNEEIYSFSYGTANGEYYGARRNEKGVIEIMKNDAETGGQSWYYSVQEDLTAGELVLKAGSFDPRTRDWYKAAQKTGTPVFSPIYKHFVIPDLAISSGFPIYNNEGELQGVLGTHIILSSINKLLNTLAVDKNGYAVIVERSTGLLIANSFNHPNFLVLDDGRLQRLKVEEIGNDALIGAYEHYIATGETEFMQKVHRDRLFMDFQEYTENGVEWVVMSAVPEGLLNKDITRSLWTTAILVILSVLMSIILYYVITRKLIKPVGSLISTAQKIAEGDLSQRVPVVRDDELGRISDSFNRMADTISGLVNNLEATVAERTGELAAVNDALVENREQLRLILDSTAEAIYGIDMEGRCTFCNASCLSTLWYQHEDELLGRNMHLQIHYNRRDGSVLPIEECKVIQALAAGVKAHVSDEVFWRSDGSCFDVEYYSYPQYKEGELVGAVVTFMDITERKRGEEKILYLSEHDSLTGLMNRRSLEEALRRVDDESNLPISVIFADLNGLKLTNDIYGHAAGDNLIQKSAEILRKVCREEDIIARVGGDEFIILLLRTEAYDAEKIIHRVKAELSMEKVESIKCSMALGADTKTRRFQDIEKTMANAEDEMYKEKTLNRKAYGTDTLNAIINTLHEVSAEEKRHSVQVGEICENIARELKLPETEVKKTKRAGYLHDIGKVVLKKELLEKKGPLNEDETNEVQQHSATSYRILNLFNDTLDIADAVYSHHERWDGFGYPQGLKGEEIPLMSRIIALAENYDRRMYGTEHQSADKEAVIQYIRENRGKRFDPDLADVFIRYLHNG